MKLAIDARIAELTPDQLALLIERTPTDEGHVQQTVRRVLSRVRSEGDAGLFALAKELDGVTLKSLEIPRERWKAALNALDRRERAGWERAARNILAFHSAQIPPEVTLEVEPGVRLGRRAVPLKRVGVYAPGGRAAYPSSVLMGVVPARAVGVPEIVVCSPPGPNGEPPEAVLAACELAGATRLFALGGAGAVAAMAYGTGTVPRVDSVVGPGSVWVREAKRQVAGDLRIDAPAGPSEVVVVADDSAEPARVAAELIAQAEHDPEASVAVIAWQPEVLEAVRSELGLQIEDAPRRAIIEAVLASRGACLLAASREEALGFAQRYAAEHLALYTDDPRGDLESQTRAGTVFLGDCSSVAFGDYLTGANHVLPTAGLAGSFSGLSVLEFLRFYTWQDLTPDGAASMASDVRRLALSEGLPAHAAAATARSDGMGGYS